MSKLNKVLFVVVAVLLLAFIGVLVWQQWFSTPDFYAVYLRTGDLYFGRLVRFPSFGLEQVYLLQVNQGNQQNPLSVQKFTNVFWGPEDYLNINRQDVVWMTRLRSDSQLRQLLLTNPSLQAPAGSQNSAQNQAPSTQLPVTPESTSTGVNPTAGGK